MEAGREKMKGESKRTRKKEGRDRKGKGFKESRGEME